MFGFVKKKFIDFNPKSDYNTFCLKSDCGKDGIK